MPYTIDWHPDLSALIVRYQGSVSADEYRQMCAERARLLHQANKTVSVVMDMQKLQNFPDAIWVGEEDDVLQHPNVRDVLLVLDSELYEKLADSLMPDSEGRWPVHFFPDVEQALAFARQRPPE